MTTAQTKRTWNKPKHLREKLRNRKAHVRTFLGNSLCGKPNPHSKLPTLFAKTVGEITCEFCKRLAAERRAKAERIHPDT